MTEAAKKAPTKKAAPKPNAKPGDPNYDWTQDYPDEEVFVFTASDGTTVGLTKLGPNRRPKPGKLALLDEQNNGIKVLWYFLKLASSDASREVQAELEEEDYAAMTREWAEFAGIELGE